MYYVYTTQTNFIRIPWIMIAETYFHLSSWRQQAPKFKYNILKMVEETSDQ